MHRGDQKPMRTSALRFVFVLRSLAALSSLLALLLSGCAVLFGEKRSLVTTVQAGSSSPARFTETLSLSTRYIEFDSIRDQAGNQRLRITVVNRGRSAFEIKRADGNFTLVTPGIPAELYSAEFPSSTNSLHLPVSGVHNRTPCEFEMEVSNPTWFQEGIRVYLFNSAAPM